MSAVMKPTVSPATRKQAEEILKKGKVQLAISHPFFGQIALNRHISICDDLGTACIDARGRIRIGTEFLSKLSPQQVVWLLAHESMHFAMLHLLRRSFRDQFKWNYACDAVINDLLADANVGEVIPNCVNMPGSKDKTSEKVYDELPDPPKGQGQYQPGDGNSDLDEKGDGGGMSDSDKRELEEQARIEIAQAVQVAKAQGKLPTAIERMVDEIINPKTPWHQILRHYMVSFVKADYSWRRPNRRLIGQGLYLPSSDRIPKMGTVVIQSDESGSIGDAERKHFGGHINAILEQCRPERVIVLHTDTQVHKDEEFTQEDFPIPFKTYASGGTDMTAGIQWCHDNGVEPEVFITLTDGYTPFPDKHPGFPLIWLITTDVEAPIGDTIHYEITE